MILFGWIELNVPNKIDLDCSHRPKEANRTTGLAVRCHSQGVQDLFRAFREIRLGFKRSDERQVTDDGLFVKLVSDKAEQWGHLLLG
jgi:hypothetical protein